MANPFDVIKTQGTQYLKDVFGGSLNPELTSSVLRTGGEMLTMAPSPVGDIASAAMTVDALRQGNYKDAALNAIGILPFVPGMTKMFKDLPVPHGTTPLKEGHVRLYHQTDGDNLRAIEKEGLLLDKAKGIEGPKAIYAGETPFYGAVESRPTLEFQVPKDQWQQPFVLRDVTPDDIIGAHYPWHHHARYLEDPSNSKSLERALSGGFDNLDGDTGKAVKYLKEKYK